LSAPALLVDDAPLRTRLRDHHRDVVRDGVVQLARDPRPLLHDRSAGGHVTLALGQLRASLAVVDDPPHQQHHNGGDDGEGHAIVENLAPADAEGDPDRHHQREAQREAARRTG
jgi:hypothetical protein